MKNIVLIGFMGSGKTTVGRQLAIDLHLAFCDTDDIVENWCKHSVGGIFARKGEDYFREMETRVIDELSEHTDHVISCGGGAILRNENVNFLKKNGILVYLKAPFEVLYDRIKASTDRPLLQTDHPEDTARKLWAAREKIYEMAADLAVDVSKKSIADIVGEIKKLVK